ncbi:MAG TPA: hypothetical protein VLE99_03130 [Candidatus Saccharimonadales bacterium]|nr:hypothetical protein [Candidatus Saccharimonadales bacterium]
MAKAGLGEALVNARQRAASRWFALRSRWLEPQDLRITPLAYRCVPKARLEAHWATFEGVQEGSGERHIGMVAVDDTFAEKWCGLPGAEPVIARTVGRLVGRATAIVVGKAPAHVLPDMARRGFRYGICVGQGMATAPGLLLPGGHLWVPPEDSFKPEGPAMPLSEARGIPWTTRMYN